jgi:hypothetical protein
MGHGNFVTCEDCGYEREFMLGVGMMYGSLEKIIQFLDKKSLEEVSIILKDNPDPYYETDGHCVYQCQQCFSVREKIYLLIYDKNKKIIYRTSSICSKCKIKRKRVQEKDDLLHQIICPKCKTKELNVSGGMCWD